MTSETETPRITELHVRMDCNGCVHKIRKSLSGVDGVGEVHVDQANDKITVVGIADPERIVKAIRRTKRVPTICSHTEPAAAPAPPAEGEAPPADAPPPPPPAEEAPPEPAAENKESEAPPAETPANDATTTHMVHDYPYRRHWSNMHGVRNEAAPYYYAAHGSYGGMPSPYLSDYGDVDSPAQEGRCSYHPAARGKGDGSHITSMFSDENPNACSIA